MIRIDEPESTYHGRTGTVDYVLSADDGHETVFVRLRGDEGLVLPFARSAIVVEDDPHHLVEVVEVEAGAKYDRAGWRNVIVRKRLGGSLEGAVQDALSQTGWQIMFKYIGFKVVRHVDWRWEVSD